MKFDQSLSATYLSDKFTEEDFARMRKEQMYAIYSAPDTGKTTLITTKFQAYLRKSGKKALYLTSRRVILDQIKDKVDNSLIYCCTYQKIETNIYTHDNFDDNYDFIVCDEAHYFIDDALLSDKTDLSFKFVNDSEAIVILMSGTPDYISCLEGQWRRPIKTLATLDKSNHNIMTVCLAPAASKDKNGEYLLEEHLEKLAKEQKRIIVYDSNIDDLFKMSAKFEQRQDELGIKVSFICSTNNKRYATHCDKERLAILTDTERIDSDMLFITSALNTGVSIDEDFEYLFIFGNPSKTAIFQLIARVRKGKSLRKIKTIFCSVPLYSSLVAQKEQKEIDLLFIDDNKEWQTKTRARRFPVYVQPLKDTNVGKNNVEGRYTCNRMIIGKIRQDVKDYKEILSHGKMEKSYKALFEDRYNNMTITSLGASLLFDLLNTYSHLPYLDKDQQSHIKSLCKKHKMLSSISKINMELNNYGYSMQLRSAEKKIGKTNCQVWYIVR